MYENELTYHEKQQLAERYVIFNNINAGYAYTVKDTGQILNGFIWLEEAIEHAFEQFVTEAQIDEYLYLKQKGSALLDE